VATQDIEYICLKARGMSLQLWPWDVFICTGVTGRRQASHIHFESRFYCFTV